MHRFLSISALAAALFLGGCVEETEVTRTTPVNDRFTTFTFKWTGLPGSMVVRWGVFAGSDGMVEICGAYAKDSGQGSEHFHAMLRDSGIAMNGKVIMQNLGWFSPVGKSSALEGASANCASTGVPVPGGNPQFRLVPDSTGRFKV